MKTIIIEELCDDYSLNDIYILSNDFFYEYEKYNPVIFKVGKITESTIKSYFDGFIKKNDRKGYCAYTQDKKIIGYITCYIKDQSYVFDIKKIGEISGFMVDKKFRKNGIGKDLFNQAVQYFKEQGVEHFTLNTSNNNKNAIQFYKSNGMQELSTIYMGRV